MSGESAPLPAFAGYGIELEYMIVEQAHLSPLPIADRVLRAATTEPAFSSVDRGKLGWSNEMVLHVIEIKNQQPTADLEKLPAAFQSEIRFLNRMLALYGARLMPGAMHPWMDPRHEMHLWPHDNAGLYAAYGRIFDCRSHGWANLQSMHINLPFAGDAQFAHLHAAIRLVLPILPALAASSPIADGGDTGFTDFRMEAYRGNAQPFDAIAGKVVPETVSGRVEYESKILTPMYDAIAPHDPGHLLRHEWLNSRGAIARFDRNAIEIRVIDTQECPQADLAIAAAVITLVAALYEAGEHALGPQQAIDTDVLSEILLACIRNADEAVIDNDEYLTLLGYTGGRCTARELWRHLIDNETLLPLWREPLQIMLDQGPLARRILRAVNGDYSRENLEMVYRRLCDCLQEGRMFCEGEVGGLLA